LLTRIRLSWLPTESQSSFSGPRAAGSDTSSAGGRVLGAAATAAIPGKPIEIGQDDVQELAGRRYPVVSIVE
jgi:hypothetical protein